MTRKSRELLEQENFRRRKEGQPLLESLKFEKLDKDSVRSASNMPNYTWSPRPDPSKLIPSLSAQAVDPNAMARNSVMEKVQRGEIVGKDAEEILRKSKCLAPAYNKGAVQYVGDSDAARDAGKKV